MLLNKFIIILSDLYIIARERFQIVSTIIFITTYFVATYKITPTLTGVPNIRSFFSIILIYIFTLLFFFVLRLSDEIKDYKFDIVHHPNRPLPKGTVKKQNLFHGIIIILIIQFSIILFSAPQITLWFMIYLFYLILMYNEFFIASWIRKYLVFYAITHTFVIFLFSMILIMLLSPLNTQFYSIIIFALSNWFVFNVFEFSRKIYPPNKERTSRESYSAALTPAGAVGINIITMTIAYLLLNKIVLINIFLLFYIILVLALGILYSYKNNQITVKLFQLSASLYIPLFYLTIILFT